jgi:hypothetical protein
MSSAYLNKSSKLENADLSFYIVPFEQVFTELANVLINVENLTLDTSCKPPEVSPFPHDV